MEAIAKRRKTETGDALPLIFWFLSLTFTYIFFPCPDSSEGSRLRPEAGREPALLPGP